MTDQQSKLLPCKLCGSKCKIEEFNGRQKVRLWVCSGHARYGGRCPRDTAYLSEQFWNDGQQQSPEPANRNTDPIWQALWELAEAASGPHELSRGEMVDRAWRKVVGEHSQPDLQEVVDWGFDFEMQIKDVIAKAIGVGNGYYAPADYDAEAAAEDVRAYLNKNYSKSTLTRIGAKDD